MEKKIDTGVPHVKKANKCVRLKIGLLTLSGAKIHASRSCCCYLFDMLGVLGQRRLTMKIVPKPVALTSRFDAFSLVLES